MRYLQWIPVTQRLPIEEFNEYRKKYGDWANPEFLVFIEGAELPTMLWFDGDCFFDEVEDHVYEDVTHWMSMPPVPKDCMIDIDIGDQFEANFELLEAILT